ncbi:FlgO family outer membrane protein [Wenzhouxiangella limi]|nr:FlgO family outer membrane protein [Wenzhouxiangella limi]
MVRVGRWTRLILIALLSTALLSGCQQIRTNLGLGSSGDSNVGREVERSMRRMMRAAPSLERDHVLIVTSFANVDALGRSSRLGRMLGQHSAASITRRGFNVVEILLSDTLYIDPKQGEFLLTRDVARLASRYEADAVVVGTYTVAHDIVYVTSKLVRSSDALVLAADNFELSIGPNMRRLLH